MSPKKTKRSGWLGWVISALLISGSIWVWLVRQYIVDVIQYQQYTATPAVKDITADAGLTNESKFIFYATHPDVESSSAFNNHCERKEANSPILGCYSGNRIYIFDITDERLKGIKVVTAAHELLHAEYERLPDSEKKHLEPLLQAVYKKITDPNLKARMDYYEKTEPGEAYNELHSIIGTEYASIGSELENYYKKYFNDRQSLVTLHGKVENTFDSLSSEAKNLVNQIESLTTTINTDTKQYNIDIQSLNQSIQAFNARAARSGGFTTQSQFQAARQDLIDQSESLNDTRQRIQINITTYKTLLAKLDSLNAESASLNKSLDSTLSDAPKI